MIAGIYEKMSQAKSVSGRPKWRQLIDMIRLFFGRGRLHPSEYFDYRLFENAHSDPKIQREFAGYKVSSQVDKQWNSYTSWIITGDKLLFYSALHGFGLPHPEISAVTHPVGRHSGLAPCFSSAELLADFLRSGIGYPFFSKPIFGSFGSGAYKATGYDAGRDEIVLAKDERIPVSEFCRTMLEPTKRRNKSLSGNIIQQALQPHPQIEEMCGSNISGVRVVLLMEGTKPRILAAVWKITTGENYVDNFSEGKFGNMLGNVDVADGTVLRVQRGIGLGMDEDSRHPDTNKNLESFVLPDWPELREICLAAATIAPGLRFQHWDVALTDQGPMLLELNVHGSLDLVQLASRTGIFRYLDESANRGEM